MKDCSYTRRNFFPELSMNFNNLKIYTIVIQLKEAYHD